MVVQVVLLEGGVQLGELIASRWKVMISLMAKTPLILGLRHPRPVRSGGILNCMYQVSPNTPIKMTMKPNGTG